MEQKEKKNVHLNPKFNKETKVHINPNFAPSHPSPSPSVHLNPNFHPTSSPVVHINPNFKNRPLPKVPKDATATGSKLKMDLESAKKYDEEIKQKAKKVFVNPKRFQVSSPKKKQTYVQPGSYSAVVAAIVPTETAAMLNSSSEKENSPTITKSSPRKTAFKKIGKRKLVRIKSKVQTQKSTKSTGFKKIGTKKLVRVSSQQRKSPTKPSTPALAYKIKTNKKLIKTPISFSSRIHKLVTPLSLRRTARRERAKQSPHSKSSGHSPFYYKVLNPFKVDRRQERKKLPTTPHPTIRRSPKISAALKLAPPSSNSTPMAVVPSSGATATPKTMPPPKPARQSVNRNKAGGDTVVNIEGVKFKVSENGRKLNRLDNQQTPQRNIPIRCSVSRKMFVEGEEYIEGEEPGVLIRSRNSMTRQSINSARNRSINTILKSQMRSKQHCMFFNKFGKCNKKEKGMCPYIHDPEKVAVCRKFLMSKCLNDNCLLSHKVAPEKMPTCSFFLEGLCTRDNCPYRHVKVNPDAEVCPDFLKGYCPRRDECKRRHVNACPVFEQTGECPKGQNCPLPHISKKPKTPAPAKPKRKSIGQTPTVKKQKTTRYYEDSVVETKSTAPPKEEEECSEKSAAYETRRRRLLQKVELAKQGWTGVAVTKEKVVDPDDSGPYEEIDEEEEEAEVVPRPPIGELPSFIPLGNCSSDEEGVEGKATESNKDTHILADGVQEEEEYEERLI